MQLLRDAVAPLKHYRKVTSRSKVQNMAGKKGNGFRPALLPNTLEFFYLFVLSFKTFSAKELL